jgi:hypothetical protein
MRTPRPALVLLLCVLIPASLSAQQSTTPAPPPIVSDPQAVALLQKSLVAMTGGIAVTDVTLTGTARRIAGSDDETGTATLKATSLGDSRIDLSFPSGERVEIRNHSALPLPGALPPGLPTAAASTAQPAGAWSDPEGGIHPIASQNVATQPAWFVPALTISKLTSSPGWVFSYVGPETRDGQSVVHVEAVQPPPTTANLPQNFAALIHHLSQMDIYLDPSSLLPLAFAFNLHPDDDASVDIATEIRFSDYRATSGVQMPFHVQKYLNNSLVLDLQVDSATANSGLATAVFNLQ